MSPHKSPNPFPLLKNSGPPPPDYSSCRPIEYLGQNFRGYTAHDQHQGRYYWPVYLQGNLGGFRRFGDSRGRVNDSRACTRLVDPLACTCLTTRAQANYHVARLRAMTPVLSAQASARLVDDSRAGELSCSSPARDDACAANYHLVRLRAMTPVLSAQASTRLVDDSRAGEVRDARLVGKCTGVRTPRGQLAHSLHRVCICTACTGSGVHTSRERRRRRRAQAMTRQRLWSQPVRGVHACTGCARLYGQACTRVVSGAGAGVHSDDLSTPVVFFLLLLSIFVALLTEQYRAHAEENLHGRNVEKCLQAFDTHADVLAMWAKVCHSVHRRCKSHNACEGHGCDLKADHLQRATEAAAAATRAALNASRAADALTSAVRASSRSTTSSSARSAATTPDPPCPPALIPGSRPGTVRRGKWMSKYPPRGRMTPLPTPDPERERNPSPHPPLYEDDSDNDTTTLPTPLAGSTTAPTARSAFTAPATPRNTTIKREKSAATVSLWADGDDTECEGAGSDDAAMVVDSSPRS
ncbi:hypothetical protein B0H14DRAFT_3582603 [Mycena olivaceomarginata]|nr:hypothetical protein B0H14DRAFT_3582603 [Mycena olivaceomarginata]